MSEIMEWINPREQLPVKDQLVWILIIENRRGEYSKEALPSAKCIIGRAIYDEYGVPEVETILKKGFPESGAKAFYAWRYQVYSSNDYSEVDRSQMIVAWMPYSEDHLPIWNHIDSEESKIILNSSDEFKHKRKNEYKIRGWKIDNIDE